jgi:hypothetical protein
MKARVELEMAYASMLYGNMGQTTCFSPRKITSHKKKPRSLHKKNLIKAFDKVRN